MITFLAIVAIAIPAVVYANSIKKETPKKDTKEVVENIKKEIESKPVLAPFPVGQYPTPTPAPKPVQKAPVKVTTPVKVVVPTGNCVDWIRQAGITDITSAYKLIMRESGCRVNATNRSSGAYGIPQSLPASKMASFGADYRTNPITQLKWMNNYCLSRYGSWANAYAFQISHGWY